MIQARLLPPPGATSAYAANGRAYSPTAAAYQDVPLQDARVLEANGWTRVAPVGTTAERPTVAPVDAAAPIRAAAGLSYIDSTLGAVLTFDGATWRDALTGAAA